uniref:Putative conserved secreted protein n=1 Tax=Nyssomyia neivai TaxID=330878 RepID=A0A1L8DP12_9DIPT
MILSMSYCCYFSLDLSLLLFLILASEHGDEGGCIDESFVVNHHLVIGIINFVSAESIAPCHEGCAQFVPINFALDIECLECIDDNVIIIGGTGGCHAAREECEELCEVDGSRCLTEHLVQFLLGHQFAYTVKGGTQIVLADGTILVAIHELEGLLEFSHLLLGEHGEDIGASALSLALGTTTRST